MTKYETDSIFKRRLIFNNQKVLQSQYFLNVEDEYYLYIKKLYGFSNVYKYNNKLDQMTNCFQFERIDKFYENLLDYKVINNELLIVSGYQLYSLTIKYKSLLDFYIQKVNDFDEIKINSELYPTNNLVKLLIENKEYSLKFNVDHLIMLDNDFTNAEVTFTDQKGNKFFLNKENRIITDLKGDGIKVISTQKALIYFYKRMENYTKKGAIIFDKSKKNKIMKFTIENINQI